MQTLWVLAGSMFGGDSRPGERERATYPASPRRRRRARAQGHVAISQPLVAAAATAGGYAALAATGSDIVERAAEALTRGLRGAVAAAADEAGLALGGALADGAWTMALWCAPIALSVALAGVLCGLLQTGWLWAPARLKPTFTFFSAGRFTPRTLERITAELIRMALAVAGLSLVGWYLARRYMVALASSPGASSADLLAAAGQLVGELMFASIVVLAAVGGLHWCWQRHAYGRSLMMTRAEVERENRALYGAPLIRSARANWRRAAGSGATDPSIRVAVQGPGVALVLAYDPTTNIGPWLAVRAFAPDDEKLLDEARARAIPVAAEPALATELVGVRPGALVPARSHASIATLMAAHIRSGR